jgi:hypothetical protein
VQTGGVLCASRQRPREIHDNTIAEPLFRWRNAPPEDGHVAAVSARLEFQEVKEVEKDLSDAQVLAREMHCISSLARKTHTAIATVQEVYLSEYKRLGEISRIKSYLPLLTSNSVRAILELANAGKPRVADHAIRNVETSA